MRTPAALAPATLALAAALLLTTAAASAAAPAAVDSSPDMTNPSPFAQPSTLPYELPPFDRIHDADFAPGLTAGMAQERAEIDAIANSPEAPTFANTIVALEKSGRMLARVRTVFDNLTSSTPTTRSRRSRNVRAAARRAP